VSRSSAAFSAIVNSLVKDIITPFRPHFARGLQQPVCGAEEGTTARLNDTLKAAQDAGAVTMNYGNFINYVITFLIVAFVIFMLIRAINRMRRAAEKPKEAAAPTTRECPFCLCYSHQSYASALHLELES
jgi:large conductance mechanosensitive channel